MSKIFCASLCASMLLMTPVKAAEISDSKRALINEFFVISDIEKIQKESLDAMMENGIFPSDAPACVKATKPEVSKLMHEYVGFDALKPLMIKLYAKYFTESDLKELNAFYATPIGKKSMRLLPQIMQETALFTQTLNQKLQPKVVDLIQGSCSAK